MENGGTWGERPAAPRPRRPRRRRLSRRRFYRRVAIGVFLVALAVIGYGPTLRHLGYLQGGKTIVTAQWTVVQVAPDRRSVEIRVDECGSRYAGTHVMRDGRNAVLMVSARSDNDGKVSCAPFAQMPTHVVHLGFALPADGVVRGSGCVTSTCGGTS